MAINIVVPELGESVIEATVLRWLKQQGESVSPGETVVELETDKVNLDVSAPAAGVLARVTHGQGDDVKIGDVLGVIEPVAQVAATEPNGSTQPAAPVPTPVAVAPTPAAPVLPAMSTTVAPAASIVFSGVPDGAPHEAEHEDLRATPVAERMATEYGIDLHDVKTNPPDGRITRQDIESYLEKVKPAPPTLPTPAPPTAPVAPVTTSTPPTVAMTPALQAGSAPERAGREERKKMSRRRQTIARRLVEAQQTAAMLTTFNEADMSAVMNIRKQHKEAFAQRYGVGLGITSFFAKAAIRALQDFPIVNAEIQGDEIVYKHYYDIGVAVGAAEGLVVPVLRNAEMLSFATIEKKIKEFSKKAEDGTLTLEDLRGGTFTITNGGVFGSLMSTPILNPPQPAILGLHKIQERPIAVQGQVVVRPMMYLALSYDHRLIDGREAVQFLVRIKEMIEDPTALFLDS